MHRAFALTIALALLLAGCLGGGGEEGPTPAATADPALESMEDVNETDLEAGVEEAAPPPEPVETNVSFDGKTGTFVCSGSPAGVHCQGRFSETSHAPLPYEGTPLSLTGTLTWETSSPTARQMQVRILEMENGAPVYNESAPVTQGGSPLEFMFDLAPFAGKEIAVDVSSVQEAGGGSTFIVGSMEQAFHLESVFTHLPDA